MRNAIWFVTFLFASQASVAAGVTKFKCGIVQGFKSEAEMKLIPSQGINSVDLTFIGGAPSNNQIDQALRECAALAAKRDPSKDILVSAWLRKRPGDDWRDDDLLHPYGSMKYLSYQASSKTIAVRDFKL